MFQECIFCKIVDKSLPAEILYEDADILAFNDIKPIAPAHVLIIPKSHIESVNDLTENQIYLAGKMIFIARDIAKKLGIDGDGYKLLIRTGKNGGQEVPHLHLHLIGGALLEEKIKPISFSA